MKLVLCLKCWDVFKLTTRWRLCECKQSFGRYLDDGLRAEYGGPCAPVGFHNVSIADAVMNQPTKGMGERFEAFVIPKECPTMKVITQYPIIDELAELKRDQTDIEDAKRSKRHDRR